MKNLIKTATINILSWLLHHANRQGKNEYFYLIKNRILKKYGTNRYYDIQFIEGKTCRTCNGSALFKSYWKLPETCCSCTGSGWYKMPVWNILANIRFGKYQFHQPYKRVYELPVAFSSFPIINGYIDHKKSKYGNFALTVLFLIYEKGYLKRWWRQTGNGWRCSWYLPENWIYNIVHFIKHGHRSFPLLHLKDTLKNRFQYRKFTYTEDDLPF